MRGAVFLLLLVSSPAFAQNKRESITSGTITHPAPIVQISPVAESVTFFSGILVIYKDGRVVYRGREIGTDPEIFQALKKTLEFGCLPGPQEDK